MDHFYFILMRVLLTVQCVRAVSAEGDGYSYIPEPPRVNETSKSEDVINVYLDGQADGTVSSCLLVIKSAFSVSELIRTEGKSFIKLSWIKYIGDRDGTCSFQVYPEAMTEAEKNYLNEPWKMIETEYDCTGGWFHSCKTDYTIRINDDSWKGKLKNWWNGVRIVREKLTYYVESL